jgi:hypothetical protein
MSDHDARIQEKLNEYLMTLAPLERAKDDIEYARQMLRVRIEEDIHTLAPALGILSETLQISTLDLLLAPDRKAFVQEAVGRSGLSPDEIRLRLTESSATAREELKLLGIGESIEKTPDSPHETK